jgi:hypothetical protein
MQNNLLAALKIFYWEGNVLEKPRKMDIAVFTIAALLVWGIVSYCILTGNPVFFY